MHEPLIRISLQIEIDVWRRNNMLPSCEQLGLFQDSCYLTLLTVTNGFQIDDFQNLTGSADADVQEASFGGKVPYCLEKVYSENQARKEVAAVLS